MEGILKVTPEKLTSASGEFAAKGTQVGNLTGEMMNLVMSLGSAWEGEAATAYMQKFKGLEDDIRRMVGMIQEHSRDLSEMAQIYAQAEHTNLEEIGTLASDVIS